MGHIYNVHNHGISDPDLASVIEVLSADSLLARSHPEVVTVPVLGDFNFCAPSEGRLKIATPSVLSPTLLLVGLPFAGGSLLLANSLRSSRALRLTTVLGRIA